MASHLQKTRCAPARVGQAVGEFEPVDIEQGFSNSAITMKAGMSLKPARRIGERAA